MKANHFDKGYLFPMHIRHIVVMLLLAAAVLVLPSEKLYAQPANDAFSSALVLTGASGTTAGSNELATTESCEPTIINTSDGWVDPATNSVWYVWTAPTNGIVTFDTEGSDFDTVLAVYTTPTTLCDPSLFLLDADDESGAGSTSKLSFTAQQGTNYYISVNGYFGQEGSIQLNWNEAPTTVASIPSGTFSFTKSLYMVSQSDSAVPISQDNSTVGGTIGGINGARITVTRSGPANGRVLVDVVGQAMTYTNSFWTNVIATNISYTIVDTNGIGNTTNITEQLTVVSNAFESFVNGSYIYYVVTNIYTNSVTQIFNGVPGAGHTVNYPVVNGNFLPLPASLPSVTNGLVSATNRLGFYTNTISNSKFIFINTNGINTNFIGYSGTDLAFFSAAPVVDASSVSGTNVLLPNLGAISFPLRLTNSGTIFSNPVIFWENTYQLSYYYGSNVVFNQTAPPSFPVFGTNSYYTNFVYTNFSSIVYAVYTNDALQGAFTNFYADNVTNFASGLTNFAYTQTDNVDNYRTITTPLGLTTPYPTNFPPYGAVTLASGDSFDSSSNHIFSATNFLSGPPQVAYQIVSGSVGFGSAGTLTFDDYEMSKDLIINVSPSAFSTVIGLSLTNARLDPLESTDLIPPTIGSGTAILNALSTSYPPGPSLLNFERSTFTVSKDVAGGVATISVNRTGYLRNSVSVSYVIDPVFRILPGPNGIAVPNTFVPGLNPANQFPLEAGSDYAKPDSDYTPVTGTLTWGPDDNDPKQISIPIINNGLVENNVDFLVQLYNISPLPSSADPGAELGLVNSAKVTILFDATTSVCNQQPAGAADRCWNRDLFSDSTPPFLQYPGTQGSVNGTGIGNGGTVYALAEQSDGKLIVGGLFTSFDSNPYNRLVRLLPSGYQDTTFMAAPNSGANGGIYAVAIQNDGKILIGGDFTSFNGQNRHRIARLNSDGSVDSTFNPGLGADGSVQTIAVRADGRVFIGGNFSTVNGVSSSYIARLNSDGSLDSSFNPGSMVNGPVYSLAVSGATTVNLNATGTGGSAEYVQTINLTNSTSGILTVNYDMLFQPDDMRVYYGGTNGALVYDTGSVSGTNTFSVAFGPTNGFTTNLITIVMNQGGGELGTFWSYNASLTTYGDSTVYVGGAFDKVNDTPAGGVARLKENGSLDQSFQPGLGSYNPLTGQVDPVLAIALQPDGNLLVGGSFSSFELGSYNGIVRLTKDGSVDTTFNPGTGTYDRLRGNVNSVFSIQLEDNGKIVIGGNFAEFNQTRRWGIARLFSDGTVDTSFMDNCYNHFAGLVNHYYNEDAFNPALYPADNHRRTVYALAIEPGTKNILIGGNFLVVGGGYTRKDIHPRSNVARLVGGETPGPGNLTFQYDKYSVDKSAGTLYVSMFRTNGFLGPIGVTVNKQIGIPGPGIANDGDFSIVTPTPLWPTLYSLNPRFSWTVSPGVYGANYFQSPIPPMGAQNHANDADVWLSVANNANLTGNVSADLGLSNPDGSGFTLGGEYIGLSPALGYQNNSPLTIIEDNSKPGVVGFSSPSYIVNQNAGTATITVTRTNGTDGTVSINYKTINGTATNGVDYLAVSNVLTFNPGVSSRTFTVTILNGTTIQPDRTVGLVLSTVTGGAAIGLTNSVLTIVNNNFASGHASFTYDGYFTNEPASPTGAAIIAINRLGGSAGTLQVTFAATNGTATNGFQFTGVTNTFTWNSGDVSTKYASVPLKHDGIVTPDLNVTLRLYNPLVNTRPNTNALGLNTNVLLTIGNIDFLGSVQFTTDRYSVKKYGGYALIPVIRTGGSAQTISVDYSTGDNTALSPDDYTATNGTLVFTNGEVSKLIQVPINNTNNGPGLKDLTVSLVPGPNTGFPASATLNIIDSFTVNEPPGTDDGTYSSLAGFDGPVYALGLQASNNKLYVGGDFTHANFVPRQRIARLNADGTLDSTFSLPSTTMGADAAVRAVLVQSDGRLVIGGFFTNVNQVVNSRIARLNQDGRLDSLFNPGSGADNPVYALAETFIGGDRKILVGGSFATLGGTTFHAVGRLNDDGNPDTTFNPGGIGANATVFALATQRDGKIIIGGDFTNYNGVAVGHLARLNSNGSLDASFVPANANDSVLAVAVQLDGKILIGGAFTNVNGTAMNHIARLNSDGTLDAGFTPGVGANDLVSAIALQSDTRIVLGGQFTQCSGVTRSRVTRLNPDGTMDPRINFGTGADGLVSAIAIQQDAIQGYPTNVPDEKIIIGGGFSHYNGRDHLRLARIHGGAISGVGTFGFTGPDFYVNENLPAGTVTLLRSGGTLGPNADGSGNISVPFSTSDGTAFADTNYLPVFTNVVFPVGEVQKVVSIPIIRDGVVTPDLDVNVQVDPVFPADYGDQPTAMLHIVNADSVISFAGANYQIAKNVINGVAPIRVLRSGSGVGTASVIFNTTTNGSATAGLDYTPVTNYLVTFNAGVTSAVVNIPIINNNVPQGFRTVGLALTNVVNSTVVDPSNALLTIIDTLNSPGQISFSATNYFVTPSDSNAVVTVNRTNGSSGIITVKYQTLAQSALPGADYITTNGTLTFPDGSLSQTITVPLLQPTQVQTPVVFSLLLSNVVGGAQFIDPSNTTVTIISSIAGVNFAVATNAQPENISPVNVLVQRLYNTNGPATVQFTTVPGTAQAGVNYQTTAGTLNFTNGETLKTIGVPIIGNTNVTGDLQLSLKLFSPTGAQLLAQSNTVVVIQDNEAGISFTNSVSTALKSSGSAVITVVCSNPRVEPVLVDSNSVPLKVNFFTADGTAQAGIDYQSVSGTLYFTNGIATNTFTVPLFNNAAVTGDRAFTVLLTNVTAPGQLTPYPTQMVVITESNPGFRFSQSSYNAYENGGAAVINVYRVGFTNSTCSVNFSATNGTAVNGANFAATNGTLIFTNGETVKTFAVPVIANLAVQPNLTVLMRLFDPTNGALVNPNIATLNILETGGSFVIPAGAQLTSESGAGAPNGVVDNNETVTILFGFRDSAGLDVTNLVAWLVPTNGVSNVSPASQAYGPLQVYGHSVSRPFTFTATGTNSLPFPVSFNLYDNTHFIGTAQFDFTVGTWTTNLYNTNAIVINDNTNASPYPSVIQVRGIGNALLKVTATFNGLYHTSPADVAALLTCPGGTNTLLMGNAGAQNVAANLILTFDDAVTNRLSQFGQLTTGTNQPTAYLPVKTFP